MDTLLEIEKIQQLKGKYCRYLDGNDWDLMRDEVLTGDVIAEYSDGDLHYDGSEAVIKFLTESIGGPDILTMHTGHMPEITLIGDTTATGVWYLHDIVIVPAVKLMIQGNGVYHDEYRKENGEWRISKTGYQRLFEVQDALSDKFKVTKSKWGV